MSEPALPPARPEIVAPGPLGRAEAPELPVARGRRWRAGLALVVTAFFFGTTFVVVEGAVERIEPLPFIAVRFLLAALVLGVAARSRPASPHERRDGVAAGLALGVGYGLQTVGLQYTSPSTSAFVTYLLVVFVPVIGFVWLGRRPHRAMVVGTVVALAGLVVLSGGGGDGASAGLGRGELLTLGCAAAFAVHLVLLGEVTGRHDPVRLTVVQLVTVGLGSLAATLVTRVVVALGGGESPPLLPLEGGVLGAVAFTGVFATALAFLLMAWGQRAVPASRAALILLLEPVFAALVSWLTGERLTAAGVVGGGLILAGVLVSELAPGGPAGDDVTSPTR
jgi:drug/metabolite transporter (DMT)-like permease